MDEPLTNEKEINSELTGLNKGEKNKRKQLIIIGAIIGGILLIIIIVFISV